MESNDNQCVDEWGKGCVVEVLIVVILVVPPVGIAGGLRRLTGGGGAERRGVDVEVAGADLREAAMSGDVLLLTRSYGAWVLRPANDPSTWSESTVPRRLGGWAELETA